MKTKKLNKSQWKYIISITVLVLVSGTAISFMFGNDFQATIDILGKVKLGPLFAMIACALGTILVEGLCLTIFAKLYRRKYKMYQGVLNGLIGSFFSAVTPFTSGGQVVQAYTFSKQGLKAANGASILVMMFIVSQTVLVLYGTLAIALGWSTIKMMKPIELWGMNIPPIYISFIGYVTNFICLVGLIALSYCRPLHRFILNTGVNIGVKLHLIKNPEKTRSNIAAQVATFRIELTRLFKNFWLLIVALVLYIVKFTLLNSMPYLAGLAVGEDMAGKFFPSLWSYSYVTMITSFIPIPGSAGVTELAFHAVFTSIYSSVEVVNVCNILNRFISFYFILFIGLLVFLFYRGTPKKDMARLNRQTFVDLQIVSLASINNPIIQVYKGEDTGETSLDVNDENDGVELSTIVEASKKEEEKQNKVINSIKKNNKANANLDKNYISSNSVSESFENIKDLINEEGDETSEEENKMIEYSKNNLKGIALEVDKIELDDKTVEDLEIKKAIEKDLEDMKRAQKKKFSRKVEKLRKKEQRKKRKEK